MTSIAAPASGGSVGPGYVHRAKQIVPGDLLALPGAHLKWYDIYEPGHDITARSRTRAREFVGAAGPDLRGELGFVLLHAAGPGELLLVCTWRGNNELWEAAYERAAGAAFTEIPIDGYRPTFCVWELGAVWHEAQAWNRYLYSPRDDQARAAYLADTYAGPVADQVMSS
jgi:hypothetical protein